MTPEQSAGPGPDGEAFPEKPDGTSETDQEIETSTGPEEDGTEDIPVMKRKKGFKALPKRTWIALGCIALAVLLCFGIAPLLARGQDRHVSVVRVTAFVKAGQRIRESDVQTVEVGAYRLPADAMRSASDVVGKYAVSDLYAGDWLFPEKLSENGEGDARTDLLLSDERLALSLGLSSYAAGLSGKLRSGDVVTVVACDSRDGYAFVPAELESVLVLACTTAQGKDLGQGGDAGQPATLTLLVAAGQAQRLIELEKTGSLTFLLRCSGRDADRAEELLDAQAQRLQGGTAHE